MKSAWHCTDLQAVAGAVGPPTGRDVEAENPPTVTARSTVGAGVFFGRQFRKGERRINDGSSRTTSCRWCFLKRLSDVFEYEVARLTCQFSPDMGPSIFGQNGPLTEMTSGKFLPKTDRRNAARKRRFRGKVRCLAAEGLGYSRPAG
jgi:hypothetical protein